MKADRRGLDRLIKSLRRMKAGKLEWGFFEEDTYSNPRGFSKVVQVARAIEEGHENAGWFPETYTPPRPFFSTAVNDPANLAELRALNKRLQRRVLLGKLEPDSKMRQLAEVATRQLRESIINYSSINNYIEESTVDVRMYRGIHSDKPLVETGTLYDSVRAKLNGEYIA